MGRLTRDGTAEPVSRNQILRHERGQGNTHFFCSADHVQDWQPYPVDPYSCYMCDHTYIHTNINNDILVIKKKKENILKKGRKTVRMKKLKTKTNTSTHNTIPP